MLKNLQIKRLLLFVGILCVAQLSYATKVTAVANGDWNDNATWDGTAPGCYDTICIPAGLNVTITATENLEACPSILVLLDGTLTFQPGVELRLPCGSPGIIVAVGGTLSGGGGGATTSVYLCASEIWNATMGDLFGYYILPVELVSFTGKLETGQTKLAWTTASEMNNHGFYIDKSLNGSDWKNDGFVKGAGNSMERQEYLYYDHVPSLGMNYYRLVAEDLDGKRKVLETIVVSNTVPADIRVFPNPVVGNEINVFSKSLLGLTEVNYRLITVEGRVITEGVLTKESGTNFRLNLSGVVAPGVYYLEVNDTKKRLIIK